MMSDPPLTPNPSPPAGRGENWRSHSVGYLAQVACTWEVLARKAGNVCPGREFPDLTVNDFLVSAAAIAPVLDEAPRHPLGVTILRCIEATRRVVNTNTNLGIVLLLAPLCSVPMNEHFNSGLKCMLDDVTVEDTRNTFAAIRLASPGGLGKATDQDVHSEPTLPLRKVMALARERDLIAREYSNGFLRVRGYADDIAKATQTHQFVERAIIEVHLQLLCWKPDSLIVRKAGADTAEEVRLGAKQIQEAGGLDTKLGRYCFVEFDRWLRQENHVRNPGTTADLIAAAIFVALREKMISIDAPFVWDDHPFNSQ
jgi:triphosphoribosyl-dephospho-CoA synthase